MFSDGVFAIAITLLVLDIRRPTPSAHLWSALVQQWPSFLAYIVSFLLIGVIWVNHHAMFQLIARVDLTLLWLNLLLLLTVAVMPYPTALLADAIHAGKGASVAAVCYGATLVVGGACFNALWFHAARDRRLLSPAASPAAVRAMGRRFLIGPILYAAATVIAIFSASLSMAGYVLLIIFYGVSGMREHGTEYQNA